MDQDKPDTSEHESEGKMGRLFYLAGGLALLRFGSRRRPLARALLSVIGSGMLYRGAMGSGSRTGKNRPGPIHVAHSVIVNRPPEELYRFWRNLENLPRFMRNVEAVAVIDERHSHWRVKGPADTTLEWDAEILRDVPNREISWHSTADAQVENGGTVFFRPSAGGGATELQVEMDYLPPAGKAGVAVARLLGKEPERQVEEDLIRFKKLVEAGAIPPAQPRTDLAPGSLT